MPYETVQYPRTSGDTGTEISVHWSKGSHVQLQVQRHVWAGVPIMVPPGTIPDTPTELTPAPPYPEGTVRAGANQIAYRTRLSWTIVDENGRVEQSVPDEAVQDWPIVHRGDGGCVNQVVFTEVMTRDEINHMIRVLRQARDGAYGSDA